VKDNVVLKLAHLHVLDWLELHFWDIVFVHVQQDVLDHDDAELLVGPKTVERFHELIVGFQQNLICYGLKKFDSSGFNVVVEHLTMFVED